MVEYNIVKYCRWCRARFVVPKQEAKKYYCDKCQKKADKYYRDKNKKTDKEVKK